MIDTLEEMASTLFKRWFVDFEFPDENGNPYKSSGGKMIDSELGEIPEGWKVNYLGDIIKSVSKSIDKKEKKKAVFLNTSDIERGLVLKKDMSETASMPGQAKKLIKTGDILYSEIRPKNRRYALVNFPAENYVVSTKLMVLRTNEEIISKEIIYLYLTMEETIRKLQVDAEARSGTFPQITYKYISRLPLVLPRENILNIQVLVDILKEIKSKQDEILSLSIVRDTLLPRLLSGELEV